MLLNRGGLYHTTYVTKEKPEETCMEALSFTFHGSVAANYKYKKMHFIAKAFLFLGYFVKHSYFWGILYVFG